MKKNKCFKCEKEFKATVSNKFGNCIICGECIKDIIEDMNRQKKIMKEHLLKLEDKNG